MRSRYKNTAIAILAALPLSALGACSSNSAAPGGQEDAASPDAGSPSDGNAPPTDATLQDSSDATTPADANQAADAGDSSTPIFCCTVLDDAFNDAGDWSCASPDAPANCIALLCPAGDVADLCGSCGLIDAGSGAASSVWGCNVANCNVSPAQLQNGEQICLRSNDPLPIDGGTAVDSDAAIVDAGSDVADSSPGLDQMCASAAPYCADGLTCEAFPLGSGPGCSPSHQCDYCEVACPDGGSAVCPPQHPICNTGVGYGYCWP